MGLSDTTAEGAEKDKQALAIVSRWRLAAVFESDLWGLIGIAEPDVEEMSWKS